MKKAISLFTLLVFAVLSFLGYFPGHRNNFSAVAAEKAGNPIEFYKQGMACEMKGDFKNAILNYNKAREIDPNYAHAYNNLSWIMATCSDDKFRNGSQAIVFAEKAISLNKDIGFPDTLAAAHAEAGNFKNAVTIQKDVIKAFKTKGKTRSLPELRAHLISYESHLPWRTTNRIEDFKPMPVKIAAKPEVTIKKPVMNITQNKPSPAGDAPAAKCRQEKVITYEIKAVAKVKQAAPQQTVNKTMAAPVSEPVKTATSESQDPVHYYKKGMVWEMKGDFEKAIRNYNKAKKKDPDYAYAYNNLAWIMATCSDKKYRDGTKAIEFSEKAVRLKKDIGFLDTLAAAYAETGQFEKAKKTQTDAIKSLKEKGKARNIPVFRAHLVCYEKQRPWRITNRIEDFQPLPVQPEAEPKKVIAKPVTNVSQKTLPSSKEETEKSIMAKAPEKVRKTEVVLPAKVIQPERKPVAKVKPPVPQQVTKKVEPPTVKPVKPVTKKPANPTHYFTQGMAAEIKGDFNQAIINYNKAIKINPGYAQAYNNLAWIMATCPDKKFRNGSQAITFAEKASSLSKEVDFLDTLAAAHAEAGNFKKAVTVQKDAIIALIMDDRTDLLPGYRAHLISYESHQPWRITNSIEDFKTTAVAGPTAESKLKNVEPAPIPDIMTPLRIDKGNSTLKNKGVYPYTILACSFKDIKEANAFAEKLRTDGKPAFTCPVHIPGKGDWYRVFSGSFQTIEETRKVSSELRGTHDINPLEAKMPYAIQVGVFNSNTALKQQEADLQSKDYLAYSLPDAKDHSMSRLLIGAYRTEKDASRLTQKLQKNGFNPEIVRR